MTSLLPLPKILLAPNGARRGKSTHPMLPVTEDELIAACVTSAREGAGGVHAHIRDADGLHSLDHDRYRFLMARLADVLPGWFVQITSESAGRYTAEDQRALIRSLRPKSVSVALREFLPEPTALPAARDCYHWAHDHGVQIQHICYGPEDLHRLIDLIGSKAVPGQEHQVQLVLGAYDGSKVSRSKDIAPLIAPMTALAGELRFDWMLCAFGKEETGCLLTALELGGKVRIGFENSLWSPDGSLAPDNAARVRELVSLARERGLLNPPAHQGSGISETNLGT